MAKALNCNHYEADTFFLVDGEYRYNPEFIGHAHHWCRAQAEMDMSQGKENVIVSNTFTTEKELKFYLDMAEVWGYDVTSLIVENRHGNDSIHDVPVETIDKMRNRFSIKL